MFYQCLSLEDLPEISQWNIQKLEDISYMFYNCTMINVSETINWNFEKIKEKKQFSTKSFTNERYLTISKTIIRKNNDFNISNNKDTDKNTCEKSEKSV
jgi:hypothetical protein